MEVLVVIVVVFTAIILRRSFPISLQDEFSSLEKRNVKSVSQVWLFSILFPNILLPIIHISALYPTPPSKF